MRQAASLRPDASPRVAGIFPQRACFAGRYARADLIPPGIEPPARKLTIRPIPAMFKIVYVACIMLPPPGDPHRAQ
jgi:hypothetical protein